MSEKSMINLGKKKNKEYIIILRDNINTLRCKGIKFDYIIHNFVDSSELLLVCDDGRYVVPYYNVAYIEEMDTIDCSRCVQYDICDKVRIWDAKSCVMFKPMKVEV